MRLGFRRGSPPLDPEPPAATSGTAVDGLKSWTAVYGAAATFLIPGLVVGLVCGALIGGIGGRLAMFVLRVTSDDSLHGLQTDDDFTIGKFTGDTLSLLLITAVLGAVGALVYLGVREWLPQRGRPLLFGLLGATVGGSIFIRPGGIDFTRLAPLEMAVAFFVVLPAAYGVSLSVLTERLVRSTGWRRSRWRWVAILPFGLLVVTGPFGLGVLLLVGLVVAANRSGGVDRLWHSAPVTWLGRGAVATAIGGGGVLLARDIMAVL